MPVFAQRLAVLGLLCLLSGCASLLESDQPADQTWWLEPPTITTATNPGDHVPLVLRVAAIPGLNTNAIMTLDPEARFSAFASSLWADHLPELVDSLLTRSLAESGLFSRVGDWSSTDEPPCRLSLQVTAFHALLDAQRSARSVSVAFDGRYLCQDETKTITAKATQAVSGNRMPEVVAAFQRALDAATLDLAAQF